MSTTEAAFYDETMVEEGSPAMWPLEDSPWVGLYREAAGWIPVPHAIVDLGTGTGRFPHMLRATDHYGPIVGTDFSASALAEARSYLDANLVDNVELEQSDLREWQPDGCRAGNTTYVCLEVLEHLDDDIGLVRRIPPGHQFVLSVPSYESESHLRAFRNAGEIWARYANLLTFRRWTLVEIDATKSIHVCDTIRRHDSW